MTKKSVWASAVLLAAATVTADAQRSRPVDSTAVLAAGDTTTKGQHNWFVSLLRKIARRNEEDAAVSDSASSTDAVDVVATEAVSSARSFKSRKDSVAWEGARSVAQRSAGYRVVVDMFAKRLMVIDGTDTLRSAPVATASNATLEYGGKVWKFETPRGVRTVIGKDPDPKWNPPEWAFAEAALENNLKLATLQRGKAVKLKDGSRLLVRGSEVGVIKPGTTEFLPLVLNEYIVFDNTMFIPPGGTKQREIEGILGHYRLNLGNGYLLHGTPYAKSIGQSVTHGCVRLRDDDIEWLYENVPVGTKVFLY